MTQIATTAFVTANTLAPRQYDFLRSVQDIAEHYGLTGEVHQNPTTGLAVVDIFFHDPLDPEDEAFPRHQRPRERKLPLKISFDKFDLDEIWSKAPESLGRHFEEKIRRWLGPEVGLIAPMTYAEPAMTRATLAGGNALQYEVAQRFTLKPNGVKKARTEAELDNDYVV